MCHEENHTNIMQQNQFNSSVALKYNFYWCFVSSLCVRLTSPEAFFFGKKAVFFPEPKCPPVAPQWLNAPQNVAEQVTRFVPSVAAAVAAIAAAAAAAAHQTQVWFMSLVATLPATCSSWQPQTGDRSRNLSAHACVGGEGSRGRRNENDQTASLIVVSIRSCARQEVCLLVLLSVSPFLCRSVWTSESFLGALIPSSRGHRGAPSITWAAAAVWRNDSSFCFCTFYLFISLLLKRRLFFLLSLILPALCGFCARASRTTNTDILWRCPPGPSEPPHLVPTSHLPDRRLSR